MLAGTYNLVIEQGATFNLSLSYQDDSGAAVDLTGVTARMQLRTSLQATEPAIELTTENGGITIAGSIGQVTLNITAADTTDLSGSGVYDLELAQGATVNRILEGTYKVNPEVTR